MLPFLPNVIAFLAILYILLAMLGIYNKLFIIKKFRLFCLAYSTLLLGAYTYLCYTPHADVLTLTGLIFFTGSEIALLIYILF